MAGKAHYDGPVCFVGHDHDAADGHPLVGGWHYTVVEGPGGVDMPGDPLVLEAGGRYRPAKPADTSHAERHHQRLAVIAPLGNVGEPRTEEEFEATHRHLDDLEKRLVSGSGLHPHEHDHFLRSPQEIQVVRGWLHQAQEARGQ